MNISERIKKLREVEGLSQIEFAEKLNLSKQTVSNYETGARQPGVDIVIKVADILNVSTDYIFGRSEYKSISEKKDAIKILYDIDDTETIDLIIKHLDKAVKPIHALLLLSDDYKEFIDKIGFLMDKRTQWDKLEEKDSNINEKFKIDTSTANMTLSYLNSYALNFTKELYNDFNFDKAAKMLKYEISKIDDIRKKDKEDD